MSQVILQLFKRNPFSSVDNVVESQIIPEKQIHQMHKYRILSYFDGMCLQNISDAEEIIFDRPCLACVQKCDYRQMAIHSERKKLILFSEKENGMYVPEQLPKGRTGTGIDEAPFIALISVSVSYDGTEKEKLSAIKNAIEITAIDKLTQEDIVFYQSFYSFSGDDIYILINANSWDACEKLITGFLKQLSRTDNYTKSNFYQTYTILGYDRVLEEPDKQEKYKNILDQFYNINMRMQTIPGISPADAEHAVKRAIENAKIKSVVGHYDLDIFARIMMRDFVRLFAPKELLGWYSQISIGTETSIDFAVTHDEESSYKKRINQVSDQYFSYMKDQRDWLKEQLDKCRKIHDQCKKCGIPEELTDKLLSLYRVVCQRLVKPQIWGAYTDVRRLIQRYFFLLEKESQYEILTAKKKTELVDSMVSMMEEISVLVNDRIYIDYPSFEHVDNNVYEKGAYEDLIQSLRKWMQMLEEYAWHIADKSNSNTIVNREDDNNDLFHVEFSLAPILYGQTISNLLFPSANHAKRLVTVHVSSGEMVKIKEILPSLAHEVGHYAGIVNRMERMRTLFSCSCVILVYAYWYNYTKTSYAVFNNRAISAIADAAGCLMEEMNEFVLQIDEQTTLEAVGEEMHNYIKKGIERCEEKDDWIRYLVFLSRYGLVTGMDKEMTEWIDNNCNEIISYLISFIREITADVFMILSTGMKFEWYVHILNRQIEAYYVTENAGEDRDDQWISLYARVISIACMYYPKLQTIKDICKMLRKNRQISQMYLSKRIIKILSSIENSSTSRMQEDLFVLLGLFSLYDPFISEYIKRIKRAHENADSETTCLLEKIRFIYDTALDKGSIFYSSKLIKEGLA